MSNVDWFFFLPMSFNCASPWVIICRCNAWSCSRPCPLGSSGNTRHHGNRHLHTEFDQGLQGSERTLSWLLDALESCLLCCEEHEKRKTELRLELHSWLYAPFCFCSVWYPYACDRLYSLIWIVAFNSSWQNMIIRIIIKYSVHLLTLAVSISSVLFFLPPSNIVQKPTQPFGMSTKSQMVSSCLLTFVNLIVWVADWFRLTDASGWCYHKRSGFIHRPRVFRS